MSFKKTAETLREGAHTLERDYYVNPQILIKEYDNIFLNNWICAGRSSELSKNGEYKTFNMSTESAIILRDSTGNLKAHANVCRHRGAKLCEEGAGKSRLIVCPYHAWSYNYEGALNRSASYGYC